MDPHTFCHYFMHFKFKLMQLCNVHWIYSLHNMWRCVNIVKMCEYCELIRASVSSEWHRECQADSTSPLNISKTGRDYNPRQLRRGLVPILKHLPLSPLGPDKFQFNKQEFIIRYLHPCFSHQQLFHRADNETSWETNNFNRAMGWMHKTKAAAVKDSNLC